jgi:hypothetical protein
MSTRCLTHARKGSCSAIGGGIAHRIQRVVMRSRLSGCGGVGGGARSSRRSTRTHTTGSVESTVFGCPIQIEAGARWSCARGDCALAPPTPPTHHHNAKLPPTSEQQLLLLNYYLLVRIAGLSHTHLNNLQKLDTSSFLPLSPHTTTTQRHGPTSASRQGEPNDKASPSSGTVGFSFLPSLAGPCLGPPRRVFAGPHALGLRPFNFCSASLD